MLAVSKGDVEVEGIPQNQRALKESGDVDVEKAGTEAARNLIPYLQAETRTGETGRLRGGWEAEQSSFINEVDYAGYQEFGTSSVDPMGAIAATMGRHSDVVTEAFEKETERAADKAGLGGQ